MSMDALQKTIAEINKRFPDSIKRASELLDSTGIRIPTGIFSLDTIIGGGLPRGRISLFRGEFSSAKTTVLLKAFATWQRHCRECNTEIKPNDGCRCGKNEPMRCAFVDLEGYDPVWAAALGVDNDALLLAQPDFAEMAIDITDALIRSGGVDLIAFDSIAEAAPATEIEEQSDRSFPGLHARLMNLFMRKVKAALNSLGMDNPQKPHIILVNQIRHKVGQLYGDPRTMPGGKGQEFAASIIIEFRKVSRIQDDGKEVTTKGDREIIGERFEAYTPKNKTFPPFQKAQFIFYNQDVEEQGIFKGDTNYVDQVIDYAVHLGIIRKSGAWFYYPAEGEPVIRSQGTKSLYEDLLTYPDISEKIQKETMEAFRARFKV